VKEVKDEGTSNDEGPEMRISRSFIDSKKSRTFIEKKATTEQPDDEDMGAKITYMPSIIENHTRMTIEPSRVMRKQDSGMSTNKVKNLINALGFDAVNIIPGDMELFREYILHQILEAPPTTHLKKCNSDQIKS
jgi:hypothetical protein